MSFLKQVKDDLVEEIPLRHEEQPLGADARYYIIDELEKDQYYFIELLAVSDLGEGVPAEKIIKTAQGNLIPTPKPSKCGKRKVEQRSAFLTDVHLIGVWRDFDVAEDKHQSPFD